MVSEIEAKIARMMGVTDQEFEAAASIRASAHAAAGDEDADMRAARRDALHTFPNALRRIAATDTAESIDTEDLISRARNHLDARDDVDDHMDGDARLAAAARCLLAAVEQRCDPNSVVAQSSRRILVRFAHEG